MTDRHVWVTLHRKEWDLRAMAELLCGRRLTPSGPLPLDCVAAWYRTDLQFWHHTFGRGPGEPSGSNSLFCSEAEWTRWDGAARTYRGAVSEALDELYRAHGGKGHPAIDPHSLKRSSGDVRFGWDPLRRFAARSAEAQREFLARVRRADADYRPVHEEIERRLETPDAERRKAEKYRREVEEHRRAVIRQAAGRRVWVYRNGTYEGAPAIFVYRDDLPYSDWSGFWPPASTPSRPLNLHELETAVLKLNRGKPRRIIWYYPACDELATECRANGVDITFWGLANEVATQANWWTVKTSPTTPSRSRSVHVSSHHSSHGVGIDASHGTSF